MQARRVLRLSVLLIICRSRVRAPPAPPAVLCLHQIDSWTGSWTEVENCSYVACRGVCTLRSQRATAEQVVACQGIRREGPADRPRARFRKTRKTEVEAQIELGKLLALARAGRQPDSGRHRRRAARRVCPGRRVGRVHGGDQSRLHPPHHQARARDQGSPQGPRPAAGQPLRMPAAVRQPRVRQQAVHRAPPRPRPATRLGDPRMEWEQAAGKLREAITPRRARPWRRGSSSVPRDSPGSRGWSPAPSVTRSSCWLRRGLLVIRHGPVR